MKKKRSITPTVEENGIKWAPLSYLCKALRKKGMGKTMNTLIKDLRVRNIKCEKKRITKVKNNSDIWAIPKKEYDLLMDQYETLFYLNHLHPTGDGDSRLLIKLGYSIAPESSRSQKYKTLKTNITSVAADIKYEGYIKRQQLELKRVKPIPKGT